MRYKITRKAAFAFSILILLILILGSAALWEMKNSRDAADYLTKESEKEAQLFKLNTEINVLIAVVKDYVITNNVQYKEIYNRVELNVEKEYEVLRNLLTQPEEKENLLKIRNDLNKIKESLPELFLNNSDGSGKNYDLLIEKIGKVFGRDMTEKMNAFLKEKLEKTHKANLTAKKERREAFLFIIIIIATSITISIIVVLLTLNRISKPILKLVELAQRIAARDFKVNINYGRKDEIGMLILAFNAMADEIGKRYEELENFSYIAAHDLKSPLNAVIGSAQVLLEDKDLNDEEEKLLLSSIVGASENMSRLITDLLEFAKAGKISFSKEPVSMTAMLNEIRQDLYFTLKDKNAKLIIENDLPSFICDPARFPQIWTNLISNAIKYNDKETPIVEIGITEKKEYADKYCFYIKDNGIGVEPEYLEKIFNTFQRATTDKKYEGTGIGLAIVKRIVEYHNGKIWAESAKDAGTTFYFTIPKQTSFIK